MKIRESYIVDDSLINEALTYANLSKSYTSDRHDFHAGGLKEKQKKMYEGKLGEKVFKMFLNDNNICYQEDNSSYTEADQFDFILPNGETIDIKTRTRNFHIRTLEMVEQFNKNPKNIYVSVRLYPELNKGRLIGWIAKEDFIRINRIENNGYLDNYCVYDNELKNIGILFEKKLKQFQNV